MSSQREHSTIVPRADLVDVLDQISDIQVTATCARLILRGICSVEAGSVAYEPLLAFLLRLESDIGTLAVSAEVLRGGADVERI